ncbi:MAG: VTT domain-containing protein [Candidatus Levybacteria bacterium]|nr:VTT domain-containing protein [Candidatus Levybacteria bacterium]
MFDIETLIKTIGLLGVLAIVFTESGLLFGFFLPGDSLLFTAGFLASQNFLDIKILVLGCFIAAVAGDSVGYYIGHKFGRKLFNKEDSFLFHKDHLIRAQEFYKKHGGKAIILARFMPFIRTFAPVVAGIGSMSYATFLFYNFLGGLLWAIGITLSGYFLGSLIPDVDKYLLPIIGLIIILSISPGLYHAFKSKEQRNRIYAFVKQFIAGQISDKIK